MVEIENLSFAYGASSVQALRGITLRVKAGELVAVAGMNTSGKSSLCYAATGVIPHLFHGRMQGHVRVAGHDSRAVGVAELSRGISLVMQKPEQQLSGVRFTVREEVAFRLENQGVPVREIHTRVEHALDRTGLTAFSECSPHCLSGGQLQRVAIASALAADTPVLILDEPTTFLDPRSAVRIFALLKQLASEGKAILLTEQRMDAIAQYADRVVIMHEGAIAFDGPPETVLSCPDLYQTGLEWVRYTTVAHLVKDKGTWPNDMPLPVTLDAATQAFAQLRDQNGEWTHTEGLRPIAEQPQIVTSVQDDSMSFVASANTLNVNVSDTVSMDDQHNTISVRDLCFHYQGGIPVLQNVSFSIGQGEMVALLGHNGSGKSTLVKHLNGLLQPVQGTVQVDGVPTTKARVSKLAATVGLLFQNPDDQICKNTVRDEVAFGPRNLGFPPDLVDRLVEKSLEAMRLLDVAETNPHDLGYSERKRLGIASVLAMDTRIVVLDEPTAGLDPQETAMLRAVLASLQSEGKTVIIISHDMDFMAETMHRAICLDNGEKRFDGSVADLFAEQSLLSQCGLLPPQVVQLTSAFGFIPEKLTPQGAAECLTI